MHNIKLPTDSEILLNNLETPDNLECLDIDLTQILIDSSDNSMYAVMESNKKEVLFHLNAYEGTMLTFVKSGCGEHSHIKTIYQLYLETMQLIKCELIKVVIEVKCGDVIYSRLIWKDRKDRTIYSMCSVGDALILAIMSNAPIQIIKKVLNALDDISNDETNYRNDIIDL